MIDRRRTFESVEDRHRDRWLISYADLVTLLLALFIVLYAASDKDRARQIAEGFATAASGNGVLPGSDGERQEAETAEQALLRDPLIMQKAKTRQTKEGIVISLAEAGFFAPGDAVIDSQASGVIDSIAEKLMTSPASIRIEGHTDSMPISNARFPSNWELSTARASSVLARLIERGIAPQRLSAAGYGGFQPVADNATLEGRAQNRRVDIVIIGR